MVAHLVIFSLGDLVSMVVTLSTLFQSIVTAFTPCLLGGVGLPSQNLDFTNGLIVGGCEGGVSVRKFGVAGNKIFNHCLLVDNITGNTFQRVVQFREECNLGGANIGEVRWIQLVGDIDTSKTVALTSCFTVQGTLGLSLGVIIVPVVPCPVGCV